MAKTRSQTGNTTVKKEEEEDIKPTVLLNRVNNVTKKKITKRKPSKSKNKPLPVQQVKMEEDTDTKSLLQSLSNSSKLPKGQDISQEQISQLIHYIVNDTMPVYKASRKVNISVRSGCIYYKLYKNDPEKKIPLPRNRYMHPPKYYTQEQTGNLIKYITQDKMTIKEASAKADMSYQSGNHYYKKYLKDPNHNIPVPRMQQSYTQDQKDEFIGYIINDKMNIAAASKKAKINTDTAQGYYHNYFKEENHGIATPSHIVAPKCYTQETIKEVIGYIIDDKMTIAAASRKANICARSTGRYYRQYVKDNNITFPVPRKVTTQDEIKQFIGYIVDDNMTISEASEKANMNECTGQKYYRQYLKDRTLDLRPRRYAQNQINELIGYIINDKMTLEEASKKANMSIVTGRRYYRKYLKDRNLDYSIRKLITQEQISQLLGYIVDGKMSINAASKKANMHFSTGYKYYRQYLKHRHVDYSIRKVITQGQINELVGYIIHDKMSITAASRKANMGYTTAKKYYHQYLNNQKRDAST
jgi:transposase